MRKNAYEELQGQREAGCADNTGASGLTQGKTGTGHVDKNKLTPDS